MRQRNEILRNYFRHLTEPGNSDLYDVVQDVEELVDTGPFAAWDVVKSLIRIAPSDDALGYLAAGPLETSWSFMET